MGKRLAQLTARQLAAVEPLLDEELAEAVRLCAAIPRREKVRDVTSMMSPNLLPSRLEEFCVVCRLRCFQPLQT